MQPATDIIPSRDGQKRAAEFSGRCKTLTLLAERLTSRQDSEGNIQILQPEKLGREFLLGYTSHSKIVGHDVLCSHLCLALYVP